MLALRDLQTRFLCSIAAAPGPAASRGFDATLLRIVDGDAHQSSADRLDVYAQMYWLRLHDALREDYPRIAAILGDERFAAVARAYLARFPSGHPSMRHVGAQFPDFLAHCRETAPWPFLSDLAQLEWARLAVFDAADAPVLGIEEVRTIAAPEWPDVTFRPIPALRLLRSPWPVHELWSETTTQARDTRRVETHLRVWRRESAVYQAPMDACERRALESVMSGAPFAATCAALEMLVGDPGAAAREAAQLLLRWVEDGILARAKDRGSDVIASGAAYDARRNISRCDSAATRAALAESSRVHLRSTTRRA